MITLFHRWEDHNTKNQLSGISSPLDFLNTNTKYANEQTIEFRLATCEKCSKYTKTKQCSLCHCFMPAKVKLLHASCPEDQWN
jgi:hypothetical protein